MSVRSKVRKTVTVLGLTGISIAGCYIFLKDDIHRFTFNYNSSENIPKDEKLDVLKEMSKKYKFSEKNKASFITLFNKYTAKSKSFKELFENINKLKKDFEALVLNIYYEGSITSEAEQYMIGYNTINNSVQYNRSIHKAVYMKCGRSYCYSWVGMHKSKNVDRIPEKYFTIALNVLINPDYQKWNFGQIKYFHKEVVLSHTFNGNLNKMYDNSYHITQSKGNYISIKDGIYKATINNPKLTLVDIGQINVNGISINHRHDKNDTTLHQWFIANNTESIKLAVDKLNAYLKQSIEHNLSLLEKDTSNEK
jgi:hypothetical protein